MQSIVRFCTLKSKKKFYAGFFIVGFGVVNIYRIQKDYMSNIYLHPEQLQFLRRDKKFQLKEQIYNTHPVNDLMTPQKPTIVIIGAGIIGLSQALKLLQHGNQVIVIEKEQFAATKCSAFNGNIYNPYLFNPLISKYSIQAMYNNYFNPNETATQRFSLNSINEPNGLQWILNSLLRSITDLQFDKSIQDMTKLGRMQEAELEEIKKLGLLDNQLTAQGELSYYKSLDYGLRISDSFKKAGIAHQEISKFSDHPIDQQLAKNFPYVIQLERESNIDTKQLCMNTLKYCERTYPNQFKILYGTEFKEFLLTFDQKVQGVNTNKGIIFGNKFVICAGLHSKYVAKKLAVNLPIMPCRGWIIEGELPDHAKGSVLDKMVLKLPTLSVTNLNGKLRISGCQSIDTEYKSSDPINEWGAKILIQQMKEQFNIELNDMTVRDCCRPLTPDDKMILCRLDSHNNVYVNAGHGSRGMSHCHACAEVIYQLMRGHTSSFAEFDISRFLFV